MKPHRDRQRQPKIHKGKEILSKFTPKHLAFRSGLWVSMLDWHISFRLGTMPFELQGNIDSMSIILEWWKNKCPTCGTPYRRFDKEFNVTIYVDKTNPELPLCERCKNVWSFTRLILTPREMKDLFDWDYTIDTNAPKTKDVVESCIHLTNIYMSQMYQTHADLKVKAR